MTRCPSVLVGLGLVFSLGCGNRTYEGPQRYPLSGHVSFDGQPVDSGSITFISQTASGRVSGGPITDGAYSIPEEKGADAGMYRVEIHWWKKTGKQFYDKDAEETVDERKEAIPKRYHEDSELTAEVSEGHTTFDFDLKGD